MSLNKPYPYIFRNGSSEVNKPFYEEQKSEIGINFLSSYEILKKDLRNLFEYIEPSSLNLKSYSHRTFELLLRACIEVEALCKLVFSKNKVILNNNNQNIIRYSDLNGPMRLSEYEIICYGFCHPNIKPFLSFSNQNRSKRSPPWYKAYNDVKHNRTELFKEAELENVIQAITGVYTLLIAQFGLGFDHKLQLRYENGNTMDKPDLFRVKNLPEWNEEEKYEFDWDQLKSSQEPYIFNSIPIIP